MNGKISPLSPTRWQWRFILNLVTITHTPLVSNCSISCERKSNYSVGANNVGYWGPLAAKAPVTGARIFCGFPAKRWHNIGSLLPTIHPHLWIAFSVNEALEQKKRGAAFTPGLFQFSLVRAAESPFWFYCELRRHSTTCEARAWEFPWWCFAPRRKRSWPYTSWHCPAPSGCGDKNAFRLQLSPWEQLDGRVILHKSQSANSTAYTHTRPESSIICCRNVIISAAPCGDRIHLTAAPTFCAASSLQFPRGQTRSSSTSRKNYK